MLFLHSPGLSHEGNMLFFSIISSPFCVFAMEIIWGFCQFLSYHYPVYLQAFVDIWKGQRDSWRRDEYQPGRSSAVRQKVITAAHWPTEMDLVICFCICLISVISSFFRCPKDGDILFALVWKTSRAATLQSALFMLIPAWITDSYDDNLILLYQNL